MLGDLDLKRIRDDLADLSVPLTLVIHGDPTRPELTEELREAAKRIQAAGGDAIHIREGAGAPATPALSLSYCGRGNIHYLGLPEGPEALPFLEALLDLPKGAVLCRDPWVRELGKLRNPAELMVFMAIACPHCPQAVRAANRIAVASDLVTTCVVDVQRYPGLAERYNVKSVPLTLIDRTLSLAGVVPPARLVELLLSRGEDTFGEAVLASMLEGGRLDDAATHLLERPERLVALWKESTTATRIGLLLCAGKVLLREPEGLDRIVEALLPLLAVEDAALRGDTADLLGQIGHGEASSALEALTRDSHPDVAEVAAWALGELRPRR